MVRVIDASTRVARVVGNLWTFSPGPLATIETPRRGRVNQLRENIYKKTKNLPRHPLVAPANGYAGKRRAAGPNVSLRVETSDAKRERREFVAEIPGFSDGVAFDSAGKDWLRLRPIAPRRAVHRGGTARFGRGGQHQKATWRPTAPRWFSTAELTVSDALPQTTHGNANRLQAKKLFLCAGQEL